MPIYYGGKNIQSLYFGGKKIASAWYGGKVVYRAGISPGTVLWSGHIDVSRDTDGGGRTTFQLKGDLTTLVNGVVLEFQGVPNISLGTKDGLSTDGVAKIWVPKKFLGTSVGLRISDPGWWNIDLTFNLGTTTNLSVSLNNQYVGGSPTLVRVTAY